MKKRVICFVLAIVAILCLNVLIACDDGAFHIHTFSKEWKFDSVGHWHEATCGHDVIQDREKHEFIDNKCTVCKYKKSDSETPDPNDPDDPIDPDDTDLIDEAFEVDGIRYIISYGEAVVADQRKDISGAISIPSSIEYEGTNYNVTSIGNAAFENCRSLTSIEIPSSVTLIGTYTFRYCSNLASINS